MMLVDCCWTVMLIQVCVSHVCDWLKSKKFENVFLTAKHQQIRIEADYCVSEIM